VPAVDLCAECSESLLPSSERESVSRSVDRVLSPADKELLLPSSTCRFFPGATGAVACFLPSGALLDEARKFRILFFILESNSDLALRKALRER
jgi:hypothetical protein